MGKGYENIQLKVETVKKFVRLLLNICVVASGNISCFFLKKNVRLLLKANVRLLLNICLNVQLLLRIMSA